MNLPPDFLHNIQHAFGLRGQHWLEELPSLLGKAAGRWNLKIAEPYLLSYNYVCRATRANGTPVVLKLGVPNPELASEMITLQTWGGRGAVRLLEMDVENGMCLLEQLTPGRMLAELEQDGQATEIAASLMLELWQPAPADSRFIQLTDWFSALDYLWKTPAGSLHPFNGRWLGRVRARLPELLADQNPLILLHGDLHHYNILQHGARWLAIDPKGVVGPRGYEVGPLLMNPLGFAKRPQARQQTARRVDVLREVLGMEKEEILDWAICHSLLSGFWDMAEDGSGTEDAAACAEIFLSLGQ